MIVSNTPPRVTIGITCYNAEHHIGRAIASARAQMWPDLEILVVDDASTDQSASVAQAALGGASNARLIRRPANGGVAAARNTLLSAASGHYIVFFDDDDISLPERVAVQVKALEAARAAQARPVVCFCSGERNYDNGYSLACEAIGSRDRAPDGDEIPEYLLFNRRAAGAFYGAGVPSCAILARLEDLKEIGGYDERLGRVEDVDIAIRLALAGVGFIGCPERLYIQQATRGSDKTPARNLAAELLVVDKHKDWLRSRGMYDHARAWFQFREAWFSRRRTEALMRVANMLIRKPGLTLTRLLQSGPKRLVHERHMVKAQKALG